jgi:glycosyltransferase involved in cell wall biosynthesis
VRILTVVAGMGVGGTERAAQNLTLGLQALGAEVAVLAHAERGQRERAYREAGIAVFGPGDVAAARVWGAEIVHIHRPGYSSAVETALIRELKAPGTRVVETNVFGRFDAGKGGALIDAHCLLSRWCAYKWQAWGGAAALAKEMHVLPNPIDPVGIGRVSDACRDTLRKKLGVPGGRFLFGRIGQPHPAKWSPRMFEAFADVLARGHDVGLMLVGAPPDMIAALGHLPDPVRARIVALPVTASDRRISEYLTAMDGFLHVSRIGESFGMVLCEAMLCGVPVVTLSTPLKDNSQLEVVGHRMGGLVALTQDALPEAMIALIEDADLGGRVRTGGAAWVRGRFATDLVSRRAMEIYEGLLSGRGREEAPAPDRRWLDAMLAQGYGRRPSVAEATAFRLLHMPLIYRAYLALVRKVA